MSEISIEPCLHDDDIEDGSHLTVNSNFQIVSTDMQLNPGRNRGPTIPVELGVPVEPGDQPYFCNQAGVSLRRGMFYQKKKIGV